MRNLALVPKPHCQHTHRGLPRGASVCTFTVVLPMNLRLFPDPNTCRVISDLIFCMTAQRQPARLTSSCHPSDAANSDTVAILYVTWQPSSQLGALYGICSPVESQSFLIAGRKPRIWKLQPPSDGAKPHFLSAANWHRKRVMGFFLFFSVATGEMDMIFKKILKKEDIKHRLPRAVLQCETMREPPVGWSWQRKGQFLPP